MNSDDNHHQIKLGSEIDASHGTLIEDLDQPLVLYKERRQALAALHKRLKVVLIVLPIFCCEYVAAYPNRWWVAICYFTFFACMYLYARRKCLLSVRPVMEMNSAGLVLRTQGLDISIPWGEIKEARARQLFGPTLAIVLVKPGKTACRGTFVTQLLMWPIIWITWFYRLLGLLVTPIELYSSEFSIGGEALAEQINLRRAHYLEKDKLSSIESEK